jgi:hypothetical protein
VVTEKFGWQLVSLSGFTSQLLEFRQYQWITYGTEEMENLIQRS